MNNVKKTTYRITGISNSNNLNVLENIISKIAFSVTPKCEK